MPQLAYNQLLELARSQASALARGDVDSAVELLTQRAEIIRTLPSASGADEDAIREIMRLDRDLSSAIRERMIEIRNEVVAGRHGRAALSGYRPQLERSARAIDAAG
jgi:hypothetical protein